MSIVKSNSFYQTEGGTLPLDAPTYVGREADEQLYQFGRATEGNSRVCFVLAPRQTGKSSLMVRTAKRLTEENLICVRINIHEFAGVESERVLWFSLLDEICKQVPLPELNLPERLKKLWNRKTDLAPGLQFKNFLLEEILSKIAAEKLVIFIDEIQDLVDLKLQNVFFGVIRNLSDQTDKPELKKLAFVLLGVAKPSDLLTSTSYTLNLGDRIELGRLTAEQCQPLRPGLKKVTPDPAATLERILYWTGGQPFLTQIVCHLVATGNNIEDSAQIETHVDTLVTEKIITDWRRQDRQSHLQEIEHWFTKVESSRKPEKRQVLGIYRQILTQSSVSFRQNDPRHWDLLISGLVAKDEARLQVANKIYSLVFTEKWIINTTNLLQNQEDCMTNTKIYNRDVFVLVDQSDSMDTVDENTDKTRWQLLGETLSGDINKKILKERNGKQVSDKVKLYLFSRERVGIGFDVPQKPINEIFRENETETNSFIGPTLDQCLKTWFEEGRKSGKGAFIIIYTDGMLDDRRRFEYLIAETCKKLDQLDNLPLEPQEQIKILMIGVGQDAIKNPEPFLDLDFNLLQNKDKMGRICDIFVFDLLNEVPDIIELLSRQFEGDPATKVPEWVQKRHPDWYQKYLRVLQLQKNELSTYNPEQS
ncbi:AAA-like domain-containing protein [Laspinema olomoucense]|uniref:AAA-like domain-containing protein n=1 Tax=Laspinema olomoucense TaxID=3231600 RepID=UPI0021BADE66|nr:AAA-like domain-containing protein [Laspinema sp. D3d]MCT7971454.1 AAA-like domain-containing protein [Laspinema sp. D3d]